jgi:hypothetical protein
LIIPTPTSAYHLRNKREAVMTALKDQCHLALPDVDRSIALALAARRDFDRPTAHQLMEQAKRDRAQYIAALLRRFAQYTAALLLHFEARLRSTFCRTDRVEVAKHDVWSALL